MALDLGLAFCQNPVDAPCTCANCDEKQRASADCAGEFSTIVGDKDAGGDVRKQCCEEHVYGNEGGNDAGKYS